MSSWWMVPNKVATDGDDDDVCARAYALQCGVAAGVVGGVLVGNRTTQDGDGSDNDASLGNDDDDDDDVDVTVDPSEKVAGANRIPGGAERRPIPPNMLPP
mmetsp:Transcript_15136/g.32537  ORF Transcript_15136/g.32537 Transcript_15136/m.32537 type:complete len:101 (+) Transcript_15136:236-538(+)